MKEEVPSFFILRTSRQRAKSLLGAIPFRKLTGRKFIGNKVENVYVEAAQDEVTALLKTLLQDVQTASGILETLREFRCQE